MKGDWASMRARMQQSRLSHPKPTPRDDEMRLARRTGDGRLMGASRGQTRPAAATAENDSQFGSSRRSLYFRRTKRQRQRRKKEDGGRVGQQIRQRWSAIGRQSSEGGMAIGTTSSFCVWMGVPGHKGGRYKPHLEHGNIEASKQAGPLTVAPLLS